MMTMMAKQSRNITAGNMAKANLLENDFECGLIGILTSLATVCPSSVV